MAKKKEPVAWITMNGVHVPIYEGESKEDAVKRSISKAKENIKANEDQKAKDIAKNKAEKDRLNNDKKDIINVDYEQGKKQWEGLFNVATPQETANIFGKTVRDEKGTLYEPESGKTIDGVKGSSGNKDWSKQDIQKLADSRKISYDEAKKLVERYNTPDNAGDKAVDRFKNASAGKASDEAREKKVNDSFREQAKSIVAKEKDSWKNIKTTPQALSNIRYLSKHELKDIPDSKLKEMYPYHKNQVGVEIAEELLNRGYQKVGSGWQIKVPKSFAANYPNLSSSELKKKYQEYLKKNRK